LLNTEPAFIWEYIFIPDENWAGTYLPLGPAPEKVDKSGCRRLFNATLMPGSVTPRRPARGGPSPTLPMPLPWDIIGEAKPCAKTLENTDCKY
jgi:hypothetical protein